MFKDNWVKFGFGPHMVPWSDNLPFIIDYRGAFADSEHRPPLELAVEVAQTIYESMPKPITLMVSGGIDSQAMAYAFRKSGVPYRCVFARYNGGINSHDFETAVFYRQNDVPVETIDVDIIGFHEKDLSDWCLRYENNSPHFLSHFYVASQLSGTVVSSGCVVRDPNIGHMSYSAFGFERYARISGQPVIGYFFNHDPRLIHALNSVPLTEVSDVPPQHRGYERKIEIYANAGFPIRKQRRKFHGFERLKEQFDHVAVPTALRMKYRNQPSSRPYDLLFRYPLYDLFPYSDVNSTFFPVDK